MDTIFTYILKVNVLIALFYLVYQLALSKETFYKHSRWFLLSGLFISLLLPFVTFTKIEYYEAKEVLSNSIESNVSHMVQISNEVAQEPILTNLEILFLIYGIICFGFLLKTIFDFVKLFKIIKVSNSEKREKLVYINTNLVQTPFSFFNYIVFNKELINPIELQNIIKHEEAHSMQKHSFDTLLAQFFIILFWFNPIVWLYRKSIVQNLEFLADSFAIHQVSDRRMYQKTMLKITTQASNITIINTFNQSSIKKRIIMLNTNQSNRKNIWKFGIILPFVTAFMLLFQVETIAQKKIVKETKSAFVSTSSYSSIVTKNTTDRELKELEKTFSIDSFKLRISNVERNRNNEIIALKLEFDSGKTYNEILERKSTSPIDDIKIFVNTDKNNVKTCGFLEISGTFKKEISDEVIEVDGFENSENPKYFSIDNMSKNGKEVVLIVNGKIKGATEKMKIPFDEELGEMKEITPSEFEKKYNKSANNDRYYYEVKTVKSKSNEENVKVEIEKKELNPLKVEFSFSESDQVDQIDKVKKDKNVDAKKALIILNDKEINFEELEKIDSNLITTVSVMSASTFAMKKFGEKAKNGVIIIQTKEFVEKK
ncbi:M56 family metallopeptidase [Flavobacterium difficile]|uniref:M56 family metallopeptidase n=1 Tax=Flavobacterium difficile TaxID=2709659 RepID=A0ABX0I9M0_9FLAO|nr:M56 family metallopeptidase [Flavobacterium difficile]NHM02549.1 M56 family metallopeptidase [Flavobacterium difficile]